MKILLLEYITAGGLSGQLLPASLLREGMLMRDALLRDFSAIEDVEIVTTYDVRVSLPSHANVALSVDHNSNATVIWQTLLCSCDAALVVAPETEGMLTNMTRMIEAAGIINLGCTQFVVDMASNKYATYQLLRNANILTIPTFTVHEFLHSEFCLDQSSNGGYVTKPNDGAGCEDTLYFEDATALYAWLACNRQAKHIIQPYQAGIPASISMLCRGGKAWVLSCNRQTIEVTTSGIHTTHANGAAIQYKGCLVNGLSMYHEAFSMLADNLAVAMPGLNGYIGVDVIIDDGEIYVVEINPRITTSYIGLHDSLDYNPAKLILDLACAKPSALTFTLPENMTAKTVEISVNE